MSTASASSALGAAAPTRRPVHRASPLTVGTIIFLASECMFFSALFAAYFTMRAITAGAWPPVGSELPELNRALIFTIVLVFSSVTMQLAVRALERGRVNAFRNWTIATMVIGAAFVVNQGLEWFGLIENHTGEGFGPSSHAYGSAFFTMTGFHGFHVTMGVVAMFVLLARSGSKKFGRKDVPAVEVVSYYWHFVDVVWVIMFCVLFFVK